MNGETWLLVVAVFATLAVFATAAIVVLNKKIQNKDRYFGFLGIVIAALGLMFSSWQNRLAANDTKASVEASRDAAASSKDSADSARASLAIETAPALTLKCELHATGTPQAYFGLSIDTDSKVQEPLPIPRPLSPHVSYLTCVLDNYGRQPVLNGQLSPDLHFAPPHVETFSSVDMPMLPRIRAVHLRIDGIAASGTYRFWVGNEGSENSMWFVKPTAITFVEPARNQSSFTFVEQPGTLWLDARTPFAPGEKHGFIKITHTP